MSQALRILVVTRRFWPHVDDACHRLLWLCDALRKSGASVTILTARWHATWPEFAVCREIPIHRLLPAPCSNWNEGYFQKNVVAWLTQHSREYDIVYVDRADGLLTAVSNKANRIHKPVVARFANDTFGYAMARSQMIPFSAAADTCRRCARVITPVASLHRLLVTQGIETGRISRIEDSIGLSISRDDGNRGATASALFEVSSDFVVPPNTTMAVQLGACEQKPLEKVLAAVCDQLDLGKSIRLWVVGSELPYEPLYDFVRDRGWHREILFFDGFDEMADLYAVADLAICCNPVVAAQYSLLHAIQAGVPVIAAESSDCSALLPAEFSKKQYDSEARLCDLLTDFLNHDEQWDDDAVWLKNWIRRNISHENNIAQWIAMFRESIAEYNA